jgi:hypothetical protein
MFHVVHLINGFSFRFPVVEPIHTFLTALPFGDEKDLYELSLLREPRAPESAPHK